MSRWQVRLGEDAVNDQPVDRRTFVGAAAVGIGALPQLAWGVEPRGARIRIGQIGVGHAHAGKLSVYRSSADYEVVGLVEPDPELRRQAESDPTYQGLPWMTLDQLLSTPDLQAVLVETRVRDLLDNAEACIEAGKHIHLDKPAGESWPQLKRILDSAKRQQLLVQMGYMYRYNPGVILLRDFLKRGWLGDIFEVHAVMSKVVDTVDRRELAEYPGGIMFELGCHVLDLVIGILGEPEKVSPFIRHSSPTDDSLLDNMLAVLEYPRAIATVKSSAQEVEGMQRRQLVVCGTKGTFQIQPLDNPMARIALVEPQGDYRSGYQEVTFPRYVRYVDDAADMARIIRGEKSADFSYDHDLAVQRTLLTSCRLPVGD